MNELDRVPLEEGVLLEVGVPEEGTAPNYFARVQKKQADLLWLDWPANAKLRAVLWPDQAIFLIFIQNESVYQVNGWIRELVLQPEPHIVVQPSSATQRAQRRQYCRVRTLIPLQINGVIQPSEAPNGPVKSLNIVTHTVDVSGSGFAIHHGMPIPPEVILQVGMSLEPDAPPMRFEARVVKCTPIRAQSESRLYCIAMAYSNITESQRSAIVRYVFDIQRSTMV